MRGRGAFRGAVWARRALPHILTALLRNGNPQLPAARTRLPRRGVGVSSGREIPRMEWNGSWNKLAAGWLA